MESILGIFSKISKGNIGETEVLESITKLLKKGKDETNFFIIPKVFRGFFKKAPFNSIQQGCFTNAIFCVN